MNITENATTMYFNNGNNDFMMDWATISALGTAAGTLALAVVTCMSVVSANRSARATERALLAGLLPVLVPSRMQDPPEKIRFMDDHWIKVPGGHACAEATDDAIYLAIAMRNVGRGLAVLDRWDFHLSDHVTSEHRDPKTFRRLTRDLYIAGGDLGFWQGAFRDKNDPDFAKIRETIANRQGLTIDLLYGDHEGGQRTISRFSLTPYGDSDWLTSVSRHWRLDRPAPR